MAERKKVGYADWEHPARSGWPVPALQTVQRLIAAFSPGCNQVVGGHPDLPAGGQEEDLMAITETSARRHDRAFPQRR
jgi:hypothetical protein